MDDENPGVLVGRGCVFGIVILTVVLVATLLGALAVMWLVNLLER